MRPTDRPARPTASPVSARGRRDSRSHGFPNKLGGSCVAYRLNSHLPMRFKMANANRYFPALLIAAGVAVATPSCAAQTYGYHGDGYGGFARVLERSAYDNGYSEVGQASKRGARRR